MKNYSLKNGLKILLYPISESKSVSVFLTVKAGPRYEEKKDSGLAHFLEHMLFEGTYKFNDAKKLANYIESVGGRSGAWTEKEYVTYYVKILPEYVERAIAYLSDILFNSTIDDAAIEKEKGIVIEELNRRNDNPEVKIFDEWMEWVWGKNQSIGRSTLGDLKNINSLNKTKVRRYLDKFYVSSRMNMVIVGNFIEQEVNDYLENYFNVKNKNSSTKFLAVNSYPKKSNINLIKSNSEQVQIYCGFITEVDYFNEDKYTLMLIAEMLGGSATSTLFYELVYRFGIAYTAGAYNYNYNDTGLFSAFTGVSPHNTLKAVEIILDQISKIKTKLVSNEELKSNKEKIRARLQYDLETTDSVAYLYSTQMSTDEKIITPDELINKINSINSQDVQRVAKKYFRLNNLRLLLMGKINSEIKRQVEKSCVL